MKKTTLNALLHSINEDSSVNSLVQSSPVCHKIFDPDFKLRFMSHSGISALQIENIEDYYGHVFPTDSAPKSTREIFSEYLIRASKGEANTIEYSFDVGGDVIWFRTTMSPYFDADRHLIYITADSMDITSTKKSEETNRTLLETTDICLKEIHRRDDGQGFILLFMSPGGQKQLGVTNVEELYGGPYPPEFYPAEAKRALTEALNLVISTGETTEVESELVDTHGNSVWYLSTFSIQRKNEDGEVVSITGASQNITEKVLYQVGLAKSKEEAERANRAKTEFLSRMSHELRTPLNAILGFSQLMQRHSDMGREEQKNSVDHILQAGNQLLQLIDEILDISRIEAGRFSMNVEDLNASLTVEKLIPQIQLLAEKRDIMVQNHLTQREDLFIRADQAAFNQIILNLLDNAVKYNDEAGSITVDGGASLNDEIWISVSDTGPGVAKENVWALFEPFNRLGQEYGEVKGTGFGLSLCKTLVELLGGSISVESNLGKGCCFKVVLPKGIQGSSNSSASDSDLDVSKKGIQSKDCKILYIEDNRQNLELVEQIVKTETQNKFISAMNPSEGIALARSQQPDLILMDIQLPEMDGVTAFRELQKFQETRDIPVIAVSAQAMKDDIKEAMNAGFSDYMTKPIDVRFFLERIDLILS